MKNRMLEIPSQYPKHTAMAVPIKVPSSWSYGDDIAHTEGVLTSMTSNFYHL